MSVLALGLERPNSRCLNAAYKRVQDYPNWQKKGGSDDMNAGPDTLARNESTS